MTSSKVEKIAIPGGTLVASAFPHIDYADAYRVRLPADSARDLDALVRATVLAAPGWVRLLMALRNRLVGLIGLKTSRRGGPGLADGTFQPGVSFGIFCVFARTANEILLGADDRHLDFRVSVLSQADSAADWVVVTTIVRFNSWLGRLYFLPVRPLHRLIVPAMLRNAIRRLVV